MQKSKSALFLMELIIVIFFFALTSAVCLKVFVKAHAVARETEGLNAAILWADNAAECFYEFNDKELLIKTLEDAFESEEYEYALTFSEDEGYEYMEFSFAKKDGTKIYSYTFKKHILEVAE